MSCLHFWPGTQLALPKDEPKHRDRLFYFKSQRNRSKLVDCLHIPLAMRAMFQSKRKPAEEMLSQGTLLCFHAIRAPLLSSSLSQDYLSLLLHLRILTFTSILVLALSAQCNSSINWPLKILANIQARLHKKAALRCVLLILVRLALRRWACQGTCVQHRNLGTKEDWFRLSPTDLLSLYL